MTPQEKAKRVHAAIEEARALLLGAASSSDVRALVQSQCLAQASRGLTRALENLERENARFRGKNPELAGLTTRSQPVRFCDVCLEALRTGDEDVRPAVELVRTRDADGAAVALPLCAEHALAAEKLRTRWEIPLDAPLAAPELGMPDSLLEALIFTAAALGNHRDQLGPTEIRTYERARQVLLERLERCRG